MCIFVVCLFVLIIYIPPTIFLLNRDGSSWVEPVLSWDKYILLKDHNAVTPVRLNLPTPRSRVKHSTTEPLRSRIFVVLVRWATIQIFSRTCLKRPLKKNTKMVFKTDYCLMQVKSIAECSNGSILQYFGPSLSYNFP